jgi:cell division transport system ATP-binding protein
VRDFAPEGGELAFLTGRSGAGKSTLLKLIPRSSGRPPAWWIVNGQHVGALEAPGDPTCGATSASCSGTRSCSTTAASSTTSCCRSRLRPAGGRRAACRAALDKVGLLAREKANPIELSGGEQQRLAIARAVVNRPALLVADEPTANLDAESAARVLDIFVAFNQVGVTVLIATHDHGLVERYGKRVLHLSEGKLA